MMAGRELKRAEVENVRTGEVLAGSLKGLVWLVWLDVRRPDHGGDGSSFANSANTKMADLETIGACLHSFLGNSRVVEVCE